MQKLMTDYFTKTQNDRSNSSPNIQQIDISSDDSDDEDFLGFFA